MCAQDEQKAEDELAKKRAAFLLKQQRKAEEARIRKLLLEHETEQKRDEARCTPTLTSHITHAHLGFPLYVLHTMPLS